MDRQKLFAGLVIIVLLIGNVALIARVMKLGHELSTVQSAADTRAVQKQVVAFTRLFIEKVLKAEGEVDFETRLQLETAVRALGDADILAQWQKFTGSTAEQEAQREVKNLLSLLIEKIGV